MRALILFVLVGALAQAGCCTASGTGRCLRSRTIRRAAVTGADGQLRQWLRDERSWVREEAAFAAGRSRRVGLTHDVQARLLDDAEVPWVRTAAARALAMLGQGVDPATLASVALAPSTPPETKIALVEAICQVAPDQGGSLVAPLVNDPDVLVSAAAAEKATACGR